MAGTTVEWTQACSGTEDGTAIRLELFINTALRMAALGRDTVGIPCACEGIPNRCGYSGESRGGIGCSRIGGATGEEGKNPDQAHHQEEQAGMLHE
jgi:hypothetical protein